MARQIIFYRQVELILNIAVEEKFSSYENLFQHEKE